MAFAPGVAHAQKDVFLRGLSQLRSVPDRGADSKRQIGAAIETMAAGLSGWDQALQALASEAAAPGLATDTRFRLQRTLGIAYIERGRLRDGLRELDAAVRLASPPSDIHVLRGLTLEQLGRPLEATQAFALGAALNPDDPVKAYYLLQHGAPHTAPQGASARARAALDAAYRARATEPPRRTAQPFVDLAIVPDAAATGFVLPLPGYDLGYSLLVRHDYDRAVPALRDAAARPEQQHPESARARWARGRGFETANRMADARREYEAIADRTLAGRHILYGIVGRFLRAEGNFAGALDAFAHAARAAPNQAVAHRDLGYLYLDHDRPDDALPELIAAVLIDSYDADAHAAIGQILLDATRAEEAVLALRRALVLRPDRYAVRYPLASALARVGRSTEAAAEMALFERGAKQALEDRRRTMIADVRQEEALRDRLASPSAPATR